MERINELGEINPINIYQSVNTVNNADKAESEGSVQNEPAVYNHIQKSESKLAQGIDKSKLLELLGPSVSEKYSDLLVSISNNSNRTQNFIEQVNQKIDLFA